VAANDGFLKINPNCRHPRKRVIQYPRDVSDRTERPRRTGSPGHPRSSRGQAPGDDDLWWGGLNATHPQSASHPCTTAFAIMQ
jgi:hypothetical protein